MTKVRRFTYQGIKKFKEFIKEKQKEYKSLSKIKKDSYHPSVPVKTLLENEELTELMLDASEIEKKNFRNKFELGKYLSDCLKNCAKNKIVFDIGLWCWITAYYFEKLFPGPKGGVAEERYVLNSDFFGLEKRNLTQFPWQLYTWHGEVSKFLLIDPINSGPERIESLVSRVEIKRNKTILRAAEKLFFDNETKNWKPGAARKRTGKKDTIDEMKEPGSISRFIHICRNRMPLTYDTFEMGSDELLKKLPAEFSKWRT